MGIAAPLLVLIGRLLQGFSAGVELGGVSVYLSEMATPGHKGFYVSWQSASQQVAIMVSAVIGFASTRLCRRRDQWLGLANSLFHRLHDHSGDLCDPPLPTGNRAFLARKHHPSFREIIPPWPRTGASSSPA